MKETYIQKAAEVYEEIQKEHPQATEEAVIKILCSASYFPYEECLEECLAKKDWNGLNNLLYQENKRQLLPGSSGYDHCSMFLPALAAIATGDMETLVRILPQGIGESKNGYPFYIVGTNMLLALWYRDLKLLEKTLPKAEKFAAGKKAQWERASIAYLTALAKKDISDAGRQLQTVCQAYMKTDFAPYYKRLCVSSHGLYRLAFELLGEEAGKIPMPEYKNFSKDYAAWKNEKKEQLSLYFTYPEPLTVLNKIYLQPAAVCEITQPDKDSDNPYMSKQEKNKWCMDSEHMLDEFLKDLKA